MSYLIGILTWKFFIFCIFPDVTPTKIEKIGQKKNFHLTKIAKIGQKINFCKMMRIVSIFSKLLKTVSLLAVLLDLAELRRKNRKKMSHFWQKSETCIFDDNRNTFFSPKIFLTKILTIFSPKKILAAITKV